MAKGKQTTRQTMIYKTLHKKKPKINQHDPTEHQKGIISPCSTSGTHRVILATNPVMRYILQLKISVSIFVFNKMAA